MTKYTPSVLEMILVRPTRTLVTLFLVGSVVGAIVGYIQVEREIRANALARR